MRHILAAFLAFAGLVQTGLVHTGMAEAGTISKLSAHDAVTTFARLEQAVSKAGATIFARIDHAKGATSVGSAMRPTLTLIFGNPKIGTPIMQDAQRAGLDLPLRVLVYEDADGQVHLTYADPMDLVADHGVELGNPALKMMAGALDKLTGAAAAE